MKGTIVRVQRGELEKHQDLLEAIFKFLKATDEAQAALELSPHVRFSPLTTQTERGLQRVIEMLKVEEDRGI